MFRQPRGQRTPSPTCHRPAVKGCLERSVRLRILRSGQGETSKDPNFAVGAVGDESNAFSFLRGRWREHMNTAEKEAKRAAPVAAAASCLRRPPTGAAGQLGCSTV